MALTSSPSYKDGKREGPYTAWHDNGQVAAEATYKDDKLEGVTTTWDEDGTLLGQSRYKNGMKVED